MDVLFDDSLPIFLDEVLFRRGNDDALFQIQMLEFIFAVRCKRRAEYLERRRKSCLELLQRARRKQSTCVQHNELSYLQVIQLRMESVFTEKSDTQKKIP
jgi:hypothetical protein